MQNLAIQAIERALDVGFDVAIKIASAPSFQISQPHVGAIWFSFSDSPVSAWSGQLVSAYYHPSRKHTATTVGKLGEKRSVADAG